MHVRYKSHLTKFNSKKRDIRESSAFFKHLENAHGGRIENLKFSDYFLVEIVKAYSKPITRQTEEGTFMVNIKGNLLNSKTEWHQPKIVRTTIHTGGAELAGGRIISYPQDGIKTTQGLGSPRLKAQWMEGKASGMLPEVQHGDEMASSLDIYFLYVE